MPSSYLPLVLLVCGAFALGLWDDVRSLPPRAKFAGQLAIATAAAVGGLYPDWLPTAVAIPLAIVVLVGAMNSLNLLDHVDGLAAGTAAIAALALAAVAGLVGEAGSSVVPVAVAGACLGYLPWNFRRGRPALVFMGDAGSHLLGAALGGLALLSSPGGAGGAAIAVCAPLLILAVPVLDTALVTLVRLAEGRPVSQGGRDHSSHRLVYAGLTHAPGRRPPARHRRRGRRGRRRGRRGRQRARDRRRGGARLRPAGRASARAWPRSRRAGRGSCSRSGAARRRRTGMRRRASALLGAARAAGGAGDRERGPVRRVRRLRERRQARVRPLARRPRGPPDGRLDQRVRRPADADEAQDRGAPAARGRLRQRRRLRAAPAGDRPRRAARRRAPEPSEPATTAPQPTEAAGADETTLDTTAEEPETAAAESATEPQTTSAPEPAPETAARTEAATVAAGPTADDDGDSGGGVALLGVLGVAGIAVLAAGGWLARRSLTRS